VVPTAAALLSTVQSERPIRLCLPDLFSAPVSPEQKLSYELRERRTGRDVFVLQILRVGLGWSRNWLLYLRRYS
jgi:hypothetical protein